jgi:hypothetical protein
MKEKKIQMTEKEAREIFNVGIWADENGKHQNEFVKRLKDNGYIKKSELETLIDQVTEMVRLETGLKPFSTFEEKLWNAIQALKATHPEFNKEK